MLLQLVKTFCNTATQTEWRNNFTAVKEMLCNDSQSILQFHWSLPHSGDRPQKFDLHDPPDWFLPGGKCDLNTWPTTPNLGKRTVHGHFLHSECFCRQETLLLVTLPSYNTIISITSSFHSSFRTPKFKYLTKNIDCMVGSAPAIKMVQLVPQGGKLNI